MPDDPVLSFSTMLRDALHDRLVPDATTFLEMFADDGVMEFPFAPPGLTTRLQGKDALAAHLQSLSGLVALDGMSTPTVHQTVDPAVFVLEFEGSGRAIANGAPYQQTYISVITICDGRIARYRDYWNPLVVIKTMGGMKALQAAFTGDDDHA